MMMNRRHALEGLSAFLLAGAGSAAARAAIYPARPVKIIVPFAAGGPNDLVARILAQALSGRLNQQFFVENVGGAGGNIGTGQAAKAAPDGQTILMAAPSFSANPTLFTSVPYDPEKSFDAVTLATTASTVLTVHPTVAANSLGELIELIRAQPGKFSFASPGVGTPPHLLGELFRLSHRLDLVHVPFASGGAAIGATLAGHTPISFGATPAAAGHVGDGKLRAVAVTSRARSRAMPDVPTSAEAGYPDLAADIWTAVLVPAGTPAEVTTLLQREIAFALSQPEMRERLASIGYEPVGTSPADCTRHLAAEAAKWGRVIREAGLRA